MKNESVLAWHFVGDKLRDGRPVPKNGVWLTHDGPVVICESGLHASRNPFDALTYAPGGTLCLVQVRGDIVEQHDKLAGRERRILARMDATEMLRYFARSQAVIVVDMWEQCPPDVVLDYLMTGDESLRAAARDAAWDAARAAARDAAWDAAWYTAWTAARAAAKIDFAALVEECFEGPLSRVRR